MIKIRKSRLFGAIGLLLLIWVSFQHQALADWIKLRNYQAPAAISALADDTTMTDTARHLFYVNHATLDSKTDFKKHCPHASEQTIVLGCYLSNQNGIAVLRVTDARLNGVEQVTAAHEMLHAAYDRLSGGQKKSVNAMLQDYATNHLKDPRIIETLKSYETTEPGQQLNEMHSIFGTEVSDLPAPLAAYYQKYFSDRGRVVADATQYTAAFTSRKQQVATYDAQLKLWKTQISKQTDDLETQDRRLSAASARLDDYKASGNYAAYNAGVAGYNTQIEAYNSSIANLKSLIRNYNELIDTRNALALEEQQLQQQLDSSVPDTK